MKDIQKVFDEAFDEIIKEARSEGLSVYQWLEKHYDEFNKEMILKGLYDGYVDMVVNNVPSEFSGRVPESFEEYLGECLKALEYRLKSLEYNKRFKTSGFSGLKRLGLIEEMKDLPKGLGEPLASEDVDFLEEVMKRTRDLIKCYLMKNNKEV